MSSQEATSNTFTTIFHTEEVFEGKSVYLSGQSFVRCTFRSCTLIIKDVTMLGHFEGCSFDGCVWYLNMTISDGRAWQEFLSGVAPAITAVLPPPAK